MKVADLQRNAMISRIGPQYIRGGKPQQIQKSKPHQTPQAHGKQTPPVKTFGQVLTESVKEQQAIRFSAHAIRRMEERQLPLNEQLIERLDQGIRQLDAKGSRNSVVFLDETAFIVSVKNKTVVTAVQMDQAKENVFTNIDSVAIV